MKLLTSNRRSLYYTFCMLLTGILMMNLTTLMSQDTNEALVENAEGESFVTGKIVDKNTNQSIGGVAVLLEGTDVGTITNQEGVYRLGPAAAGSYTLTLVKGGFIETNITDFVILENETVEFSFALSTRPIEMSDEVYELQDFTVSVSEANDMMAKMDLRMSSSEALEVLSSEDFSKFVASDVADAVKRVTGVTVQEGGFAVIRGLDERYSSTLFNGTPFRFSSSPIIERYFSDLLNEVKKRVRSITEDILNFTDLSILASSSAGVSLPDRLLKSSAIISFDVEPRSEKLISTVVLPPSP